MEIPITCDAERRLEYFTLDQLDEFQGNLKSLSDEEYSHLKASIQKRGFAVPLFYWQAPDGSRKILDGHGRKFVMQQEGWQPAGGKVPAIDLPGATETDAAELLLELTGQHGTLNEQGVYEFIVDKELDFKDLASFDLPDFDTDRFIEGYFVDPDFEPASDEPLQLDQVKGKEVTCPHCQHVFTA